MKLYYYNEKYPEYGVEEMEVDDVEYRVSKEEKYISGVYSFWDVNMRKNDEVTNYYSLYQPYNNDLTYCHDLRNSTLIMSFSKEHIVKMNKNECKYMEKYLTGRLSKIEKILKEGK